jgi:chromosome segregation ATPase
MDAHTEIYRRLSKIENELVQAVQASAVVRGVGEELRACLHQLSEQSQQARALHLRNREDAVAAALRELEALAEQACELSDCRAGDARRVLRPGLEEARQDIRDLCHQLGLHRQDTLAERRPAP